MNKKQLRKKFHKERELLTPTERQKYSEKIIELFLSSYQVENKLVSIFLPIERKLEINTYKLLDRLKNLNAKIALSKSNFDTLEMEQILYNDNTKLKSNKWGIPEPENGELVPIEAIEIVIVPLLISDKKGYRVGYGKGFYDRFLEKCKPNCLFVGINYFQPIEKIEDINPKDINLDALITPQGIVKY